MKVCAVFALVSIVLPLSSQQTTNPNAPEIVEHARAATVVILAGEGAGRLQSLATGVIIRKDGVILTALRAAEVQVRTADGEVFDRVDLLGSDGRRDIAALKISAGNLPSLTPSSNAAVVVANTCMR